MSESAAWPTRSPTTCVQEICSEAANGSSHPIGKSFFIIRGNSITTAPHRPHGRVAAGEEALAAGFSRNGVRKLRLRHGDAADADLEPLRNLLLLPGSSAPWGVKPAGVVLGPVFLE